MITRKNKTTLSFYLVTYRLFLVSVAAVESHMQFSKNPILKNFGDLPSGEIPEPLKYNRPFRKYFCSMIPVVLVSMGSIYVLPINYNYFRVDHPVQRNQSVHGARRQKWIRHVSKINKVLTKFSLGVYVGAGSRHDSLATSGASHVLRSMLSRGTASRSKADFATEVEQMGGVFAGDSGREQSSVSLTVHKADLGKAVELLGDAVSNASLDSAELELLKQELAAEHDVNFKNYIDMTLENCHFNSYRDHMLGQPKKGDPDKLQTLSVDDLAAFRGANYFGDNLIIVGTGCVDHDAFVSAVDQHFGTVAKSTAVPEANSETCIYTPSLLFVRDDEMVNSNIGVFYDAPTFNHPDYPGFLLLQHMFGRYEIDKHAEHLNTVHKQYNSMHALLGDLPDVTMAQSHYFTYSDSALFGNYFFGNEIFTRQMNYCGVCLPTIYSHFLNEVEVIRGRNHLYNNLMNNSEDSVLCNGEIATQMLQQGRRVPRSETAKRVAGLTAYHMKHMCNKWFYDAEPSFTNWGPVELTASCGSYKYYKVNTMSTVTNTHHTLFN